MKYRFREDSQGCQEKPPATIKFRPLVNTILIWLYCFNALFIPYDNFGLKKVSFAVLIVLNADVVINGILSGKESRAVTLMGVFLPLYTIIKSAALTGNFLSDFLSGYTGMILLMLFVIRKNEIDFPRILVATGILLALFIDICVFLDIIAVQPVLSNPILSWMHSTSNANIGKSSSYPLGYYIFIKTTPILIVCLGFLVYKKKYAFAMVVLFALLFSGTRANAALGILTFGGILFFAEENKAKRMLLIMIALVISAYILFGRGFFERLLDYSKSKAASDQIRRATLPSIIATWKEKPWSFFVGQGYSSEFFNTGRMEWSSDCELAYWNLLRRVGFACFSLMMYCYIKPIIQIVKTKTKPAVVFGYIAYLVGAYVNPLLYTSTGLTVLLCMYAFAYNNEDKRAV